MIVTGLKNGPYDYAALAKLSYQDLRDATCTGCPPGYWPEDFDWNAYLAAGGDPSIAPHEVDIPMASTPTPEPTPTPTPEPTPTPTPEPGVPGYPPTDVRMCEFTPQYGFPRTIPVGGAWNTIPPSCSPLEVACVVVPETVDNSIIFSLTKNQGGTNDTYEMECSLSLVPGDFEWGKAIPKNVNLPNGAYWKGKMTSDIGTTFPGAYTIRVPGQPLYFNWRCFNGPNMGLIARSN